LFAVTVAALLAAIPPANTPWGFENAGKGGLVLWPLFGATNQLLAGLAFLVIAFYLWRRGKPVWYLVLPMLFMLVMPVWAMLSQLFVGPGGSAGWIEQGRWTLVFIGVATIALEVWMLIEAWVMFPKVKGVVESVSPTAAGEGSPTGGG
jgi:carbon starvation protein